MLGEPGIGALEMEAVVAAGNQSRRCVALDLVQTYRALPSNDEILPGELGQFVEVGRREALLRDGLRGCWQRRLVAQRGVPQEADVDHENHAHASTG